MKSITIILLALALAACGSSDTPDDKSPAEQTITAGDLETVDDYPTIETPDGRTVYKPPFSADDIREGTPSGLTQHIVMREGGKRFVIRVSFEKASADGVMISNVPVDGNGQPLGDGAAAFSTWDQLESHAYYDVESSTVAKTRITTSMGEHEALVFTKTAEQNGQKHVDRAWFALDLPGAPVRYEKSIDGEQVMTMEIVDRAVVAEEPAQ